MKKTKLKLDVKKTTLRHLDEAVLRETRGGLLVYSSVCNRAATSSVIGSAKTTGGSTSC